MLVPACFPGPTSVLPQGVLLSIRWSTGWKAELGCRISDDWEPEKVTIMLDS